MAGTERRWGVFVLLGAFAFPLAGIACRNAGIGAAMPDAGVGAVDAIVERIPDRPPPIPDAPPPPSGPETCGNGLDDDENGAVDDGCFCAPGAEQPCFPGPARLAGVGACAAGTQVCLGGPEIGQWGPCAGAIAPSGEICDGLDNDCNGRADDGCACPLDATRPCHRGPAGTADVGSCRSGTETCRPGPGGVGSLWDACANDLLPRPEVCDGMDNDCNGTVDDGCACPSGETRACYGGPAGTSGVGPCRAGTQRCIATGPTAQWGTCEGQVLPAPELCDAVDNDCDGVPDDGCLCEVGGTRPCYDGPASTRGVGACADGSQICLAGPGGVGSDWGPCSQARLPGAEICNDLDDDCDGTIDDGCACRRGATRDCYEGPVGTAGVGPCRAGSQSCIVEAGAARFGPCVGQVVPAAAGEACNGVDDDCDGTVDGLTRFCGSNVGQCRYGTATCIAGTWGTCTGAVAPTP